MKNFQQNLLVSLAAALCALCAWQWYQQTLQRNAITLLNQTVYDKAIAIRDYTNSIATLNHQVAQMGEGLTGLRDTLKTNEQVAAAQRLKTDTLERANEALTNQVSQYRNAVDTLESRLTSAYAGITNLNFVIKEVTAQRDDFVKKYNDEVQDRNAIVAKYNALAAEVQKLQTDSKK